MILYCFINKNTNDIIEGPKELPSSWSNPITNISYSGFNKCSESKLNDLGWYPYTDEMPEYDSFFHNIISGNDIFDESNNIVIKDFTIIEKDLEEIRFNMYNYCNIIKKKVQQSGIVWNDHPIDTRDSSINEINLEFSKFINGTRDDDDSFQFFDGFINISNIEFSEIMDLLNLFIKSINGTTKDFWNEIASAQNITIMKNIKSRIDDKNNWPITYLTYI